jgi:ATP-dependent DNA ligase
MIIEVNANLIEEETGELIASTLPKFKDRKYEDNVRDNVLYLEPMTAQELDDIKLEEHIASNEVVAEQKFDGHRGLIHITHEGNRMFSRRVSKQTNWFSENSDQMPHIRDIRLPEEYYGTVIDGEILLPVENCSCREVQSVTGALPETAINKQLEVGFAYFSAFDILYYKGVNIMRMPYWKRKLYLVEVVLAMNSEYVKLCTMYTTPSVWDKLTSISSGLLTPYLRSVVDYNELFRQFLSEGKEGIIIKDIYGIYEQKRSKAFIKMKAHKTYDVVIMGYDEPTREYTGKEIDTWEYWEDYKGDVYTSKPKFWNVNEFTPVTKYYAMGWIGAIIFGVWKDGELVEVGRTSGMDEDTRREISNNKDKYLGSVIEVMAQGIINKETGSLQHPRFICFRPDKSSEMCTFEAHIREWK